MVASRPFLPFAVIAAAGVLGWMRGPGAGVLVVGGAALVGAIALLWNSLRTVAGETPVDLDAAVALGSATAEDERTRRVLQALRDLDLEHKLGKVSDEDFAMLSDQYRGEAKRLLRELDEKIAPARARAEKLVAARVEGKPVTIAADAPAEEEDDTDTVACASCSTHNEPDAVFCKKCGTRLREA
jgi:ribosomal protein L40E